MLVLATLAFARDKFDLNQYPEMVDILSSKIVTTENGKTVTKSLECANPPVTQIAQMYCAQNGTKINSLTEESAEITAQINGRIYTLTGGRMLIPHPGYRARLDEDRVQIVTGLAKGKPKVYSFRIIGIEAAK